jgi:hypothetical protein
MFSGTNITFDTGKAISVPKIFACLGGIILKIFEGK